MSRKDRGSRLEGASYAGWQRGEDASIRFGIEALAGVVLTEKRSETGGDGFHTPAEAARILRVPLRRILEWLAAGEIEADRDPVSGRWSIPERSLRGSEPARQTEEELVWVYEKERLLAELGEWRKRAERERKTAEGLRQEVEKLRRALEVEKMRRGHPGEAPGA